MTDASILSSFDMKHIKPQQRLPDMFYEVRIKWDNVCEDTPYRA